MMVTSYASAALFWTALIFEVLFGTPVSRRLRAEVERYVGEVYAFDRTVDREYAIRSGLREVTEELGVPEVSSHRVFAFPVSARAPIVNALVAVGPTGVAFELNDRQSINRVFDRAPAGHPDDVARLIAVTFLRLLYYNGYENHSYPNGLYVVDNVCDIPGVVCSTSAPPIAIHPPTLLKCGSGYKYILFSWTPVGRAIVRHELSVEGNQILLYELQTIADALGEGRSLR